MKRFWKDVTVAAVEGGWQVLLDGRPIRTAQGRAQIVPTPDLAEALAAEWAQQGDEVDPGAFVLRDLADYAIDIVAPDPDTAIRELLPYAETDTLCYRGDPDEPLHERQCAIWDPLLHAAEQRWDIRFERISGVLHRPQPTATIARLEAVLAAEGAFTLAALTMLSNLAASLVVGLAALERDADIAALWDAASLEEIWQAELWGSDAEARTRRDNRLAAFAAAAKFAALARLG